jgi:hypothetical protein
MPDPTPERLAAIRERHAAATDGPWWFDESDTCWRLHGVMGRIPPLRRDGLFPEQVMNKQILKAPKQGTPYAEYWPGEADGAFISHAWEDVRDLLGEVDRLKAKLAEMGSAVARVRTLHAEVPYRPGYCYCTNPYPCPTIRALDPDDEGGEPRD